MRTIRTALLTTVATLALAGTAEATPITIGSPLTGAFASLEVHATVTAANLPLAEPGALATSPVDGVIVRWRLLDAKGGPFRLRVLHPVVGTTYTGAGTSASVTPTALTTQTYESSLPIHKGDLIGIDIPKEAHIGVLEVGTQFGAPTWVPPLLDGESRAVTAQEPSVELAFNADVQPAPTVASVSPKSGSFRGKTAVTVSGTDFAGVTGVKFGTQPASSFTVASETQLTAIAPPGTLGNADVTVTTIAGTSPVTTADHFKYTACVVPKLKAKKLKAAKKKLKKAGCRVGKVSKEDGVTPKTGKVVGQSPKPGKTLAPGAKVNITLG